MKKLKRNPVKLDQEKKNPIKKKIFFKTKSKQCDFILENGKQCEGKAIGKGNFCSVHANKDSIFLEKSDRETLGGPLLIKYNPIEHPISFIELSAMGLNVAEIAARFNVSVETIHNWRENFPLFDQAFDIGRAALEAWYLREGKNNLNSRFFQTSLFKFLTMNNGLNWTDKMDSKSQVQGQFGVLLMPNQLTADEWEQNNIKREQELQKRIEENEVIEG